MRIYIAAPWARKEKAREAKVALEQEGWTVTSRWIDFHGDTDDPTQLMQEAYNDLSDIRSSDVFFLLNLQSRGRETSGKAVETGVAIERSLPIVMVGEVSNVFHNLPSITRVENVEEGVKVLREWSKGE